MKKNGRCKIRYTGLSNYKPNYLHDLYISLIELKWRYSLAVFFILYLVCVFIFAFLWWIFAYYHGDFENVNNPDWELCVTYMNNFAKCVMLSVETQAGIGYGTLSPNADCSGAVFTVYLQILCSFLLNNLVLGFIFAKFAQPKNRQKNVLFSTNACVTSVDGIPSIQIRVGNIRKTHFLATQVHGILVRSHVTDEGVLCPLYLNKVHFQVEDMDDSLILMLPAILTHPITKDSPFWNMKVDELVVEMFELIVFIEGHLETTGDFCQLRTSYIPNEFLLGYRFDNIKEFNDELDTWEIDISKFNDVVKAANEHNYTKELLNLKDNETVRTFDTEINMLDTETVGEDEESIKLRSYNLSTENDTNVSKISKCELDSMLIDNTHTHVAEISNEENVLLKPAAISLSEISEGKKDDDSM